MNWKWIFKIKYNVDDFVAKHKARLVAKGFAQVEGIDFNETFSHVAQMEPIQSLLVIVAIEDLQVHQMDVKTGFLSGNLLEEIYMQQQKALWFNGKENMVCKLQKSLYGLKQFPHEWNRKINAYFLFQKFERSYVDHNESILRKFNNFFM